MQEVKNECENCGLSKDEYPNEEFKFSILHMRWECEDCFPSKWDEPSIQEFILNRNN